MWQIGINIYMVTRLTQTRNSETYYNIVRWKNLKEKQMVQKKVLNEWVDVEMRDLVNGDEFRVGDAESQIVVGSPFLNEAMDWAVEVQDDQ